MTLGRLIDTISAGRGGRHDDGFAVRFVRRVS